MFNKLHMIIEGQVTGGHPNGFAREMRLNEMEVGYF